MTERVCVERTFGTCERATLRAARLCLQDRLRAVSGQARAEALQGRTAHSPGGPRCSWSPARTGSQHSPGGPRDHAQHSPGATQPSALQAVRSGGPRHRATHAGGPRRSGAHAGAQAPLGNLGGPRVCACISGLCESPEPPTLGGWLQALHRLRQSRPLGPR